MNVVRRVKAILVDPLQEWTAIGEEAGDPAYVLSHYVAILAVVPALFSFIGVCLVGVAVPGGAIMRTPLFDGVFGAIFGYILSCATVLALGLVINALAPLFGGQRNFDSAFKLAVYSFTPVWLAGIFLILPSLRFLVLGGFYGFYILWLGIPAMTRTPEKQVLNFTLVIAACAFSFLYWTAVAQRVVFGTPGL